MRKRRKIGQNILFSSESQKLYEKDKAFADVWIRLCTSAYCGF